MKLGYLDNVGHVTINFNGKVWVDQNNEEFESVSEALKYYEKIHQDNFRPSEAFFSLEVQEYAMKHGYKTIEGGKK